MRSPTPTLVTVRLVVWPSPKLWALVLPLVLPLLLLLLPSLTWGMG